VQGVLYVENLVDEFLLVRAEMPRIAGQAFNAHKRNPETSVDATPNSDVDRAWRDPSMLYTHQFAIDALSEAFQISGESSRGFLEARIRTAA
jgi:hypothetical protein